MIEVTIGDDLKLRLYDTEKKKVVKSLPKRGVDPAVYEREKAKLDELKKSIDSTVKQRKKLLFEDFLSGRARDAQGWRDAYLGNPVLKGVARLIVWQQGDSTFTVLADGLIDSVGEQYELSEDDVLVAHPIEMTKADIEAWRDYYASRGLKQPFEQVWERAIDASTIEPGRYAGIPIPFYRFKGREKHGIRVVDREYHNDISISFAGCSATVKRLDWHRHRIEIDDRFEIEEISYYRFTRQVNHIIAYLDRCCLYPRIASNDLSVMDELEGVTLAQIIEYIDVASSGNATELAAELLEYRNERFPEYGSIDSLVF